MPSEGTSRRAWVAVDLGASSGRVLVATLGEGALELEEVHRFEQPVRSAAGHVRWDFEALWGEVEHGLRAVAAGESAARVSSVGVCGWGVDYGLLDERLELVEDPVCYRDARTDGMLERMLEVVPAADLYARTGIQFMPINTAVQLFAQKRAGEWPARAQHLAMIPDLVHLRACGELRGEVTNASTTQLLDATTRDWDAELARAIGVDPGLLPAVVDAGTRLGGLRAELGLPPWQVVCPATHDTASAVAGTPLEPGWAYLSSGTWSLLGLELDAPVLTDEARVANFTNEAGVGGSVRLLKNVMGLWILEQCRASWARRGAEPTHDELARALAGRAPGAVFIDPDDPSFLHPVDMALAVAAFLERTGQPVVSGPVAVAQVVLESLALRYAQVVRDLRRVTGQLVRGIHVVGGGSRNRFLAQATADACALPVRTGPTEATSLGNVLVQATSGGRFADLRAARGWLAGVSSTPTFEPSPTQAWRRARERFDQVVARAREGD